MLMLMLSMTVSAPTPTHTPTTTTTPVFTGNHWWVLCECQWPAAATSPTQHHHGQGASSHP